MIAGISLAPRRAGLIVAVAIVVGAGVGGTIYASSAPRVPIPLAIGVVPAEQATLQMLHWSVPLPLASTTATNQSPTAPSPAAGASPLAGRLTMPVHVAIPALFLHAPINPVSASGGFLQVPAKIGQVGWWSSGGVPGASVGTVVLDGHVDSAVHGLGALWPLRFARPGEQIQVELSSGATVTYHVAAVRSYPKNSLPSSLFAGPTGAPRLALITCGGTFDSATHHYGRNVVVWGVPGA